MIVLLASPCPSPGSPAEQQGASGTVAQGGESITCSGQVLDPAGRPYAGARLFLVDNLSAKEPARTTSDAKGRFRFSVKTSEFSGDAAQDPGRHPVVVAIADGYGLAATAVPNAPGELTLRLAEGDTPVAGRLLDPNGRVLKGATVRVRAIKAPRAKDLGPWLQAVKARGEAGSAEGEFLQYAFAVGGDSPGPIPPVTTDDDGRFTIKGLGRERLVSLLITAPSIEVTQLEVMTREADAVRVPRFRGPRPEDEVKLSIYGATFTHKAGPTRPVEGVVRDQDTGKPLPGVKVRCMDAAWGFLDPVNATTDAEGRYRLVGLPSSGAVRVFFLSPEDRPYALSSQTLGEAGKPGTARLDVALKRGVWVKGRVTDRTTGRPVRAHLAYFAFADNPEVKNYAGLAGTNPFQNVSTAADGTFRLVAVPGRGLVGARAFGGSYRVAVGASRIKGVQPSGFIETYPYFCPAREYNTLAEISPSAGDESVSCDLALEPGRSVRVKAVGPDGKPRTGTRAFGLTGDVPGWSAPQEAETFEVTGIDPAELRSVVLRHEGERLAGRVTVRGDESGVVTVKLVPWGVVTGRLVDAKGQAKAGGSLQSIFALSMKADPEEGRLPGSFEVGEGGRFRIEGLAAGLKYSLAVRDGTGFLAQAINGVSVLPGELKDLGAITVPSPGGPMPAPARSPEPAAKFDPRNDKERFRQDFRTGKADERWLQVMAPAELKSAARSEAKGMRITIPAKSGKTVGVRTTFGVRGDFEVTASYEVLSEQRPMVGWGVGPELYIKAPGGWDVFATFGRYVKAENTHYTMGRGWLEGGERKTQFAIAPTEAREGKLRLVRIAGTLHFQAAEGAGNDFRELHQTDYGTDDLEMVRVAAVVGDSPAALDIVWKDLTVRAEALPGRPVSTDVTTAPPVALRLPGEPSGGFNGFALAGASATLLIASGAWWAFSRWHKQAPAPKGGGRASSAVLAKSRTTEATARPTNPSWDEAALCRVEERARAYAAEHPNADTYRVRPRFQFALKDGLLCGPFVAWQELDPEEVKRLGATWDEVAPKLPKVVQGGYRDGKRNGTFVFWDKDRKKITRQFRDGELVGQPGDASRRPQHS
jgi:hypothetical protein